MTKTHKSSSSTTTTTTTTTSTSTSTSACAACKYQRRRCTSDCILAPHFPANNPLQFRNVHRLFGVSNILKILKRVAPQLHKETMTSIIMQSNIRAQDPVGGCYRFILDLKFQIDRLSAELQFVLNQLAFYRPQFDATANVASSGDANYTQAVTAVDAYGNMTIMQQQPQQQLQQQYCNSFSYDFQEKQDSNHGVIAPDNNNNNLSSGIGFDVNMDNLGNSSLEMEMMGSCQNCVQEDAMKPFAEIFDMENTFEYGENSKDLTVASSFVALHASPNNVLRDDGSPNEQMQEHELKVATALFH
ncbi:LOB domain-containing protein 7-like [Phalaenopsis equestris]|uniref:LOB domain-containing protein 7-like n=1 Tax=Phalaenopsis equestris TaxID=78828 RepID=UPI0009E31371|nr:LOB domain-containing protein 7-like [Phalaenopsis equestris]